MAAARLGLASWLATAEGAETAKKVRGFDETDAGTLRKQGWKPVSDRKVRVGIVGYRVCRFGAAFGFQDHPNVEVAAVSDLFPDRCAALAKACRAGALGRLIYSEGQSYHCFAPPLGSFKNWRHGLPPMWYPTRSTAYYVAVTGGSFTAVSCQGLRGAIEAFKPEANAYRNPFDSEVALFRTHEGGASRMSVCRGTRGSHGYVACLSLTMGRCPWPLRYVTAS